MSRYRKRPVVIDAMQWTGAAGEYETLRGSGAPVEYSTIPGELYIMTLEDGHHGEVKHVASLNDWIIRGVKGEFYACKPDIFAVTYEKVEE